LVELVEVDLRQPRADDGQLRRVGSLQVLQLVALQTFNKKKEKKKIPSKTTTTTKAIVAAGGRTGTGTE
jgi:hypothetical protein